MKSRTVVALAAAAVAVMNLVAAFLFHPPWWATSSISLVASAIATQQALRLTKERRNGRHRQAEADTPDPETDRAALARARHAALYHASPYTRPGVTRTEPADEFERVESDLPILAHRSARLRLDGTSRPFGSVATEHDVGFGVDGVASCNRWMNSLRYSYGGIPRPPERHAVPSPSCTCGFYALPTDLAATYENPGYVTLMVELSGTVIEHERGYRAEHQRVIECQVQPCVYCGAEADLLVVHQFMVEQATCADHKPVDEPGKVYLDVADLTALLPVPVTRKGRRKPADVA